MKNRLLIATLRDMIGLIITLGVVEYYAILKEKTVSKFSWQLPASMLSFFSMNFTKEGNHVLK